MVKRLKLIVSVLIVFPAFAQNPEDGDKLVLVPQKYLSQDALAHKADASLEGASRWVGFGKEIGQAMNEGLGAVVTQTDKFGATRVGTFVMVMVAWKVIGHELLAVVLGIPIMIAGVGLWVWSFRRFFWPIRTLAKQDGKAKEWTASLYEFESREAKTACGFAHLATILAWLVLWVVIIFA